MKEEKILATTKELLELENQLHLYNFLCLDEKEGFVGKITNELKEIYSHDPYVFLWAAKKSIDQNSPYGKSTLSYSDGYYFYPLYIEAFLDLLSSARDLKYEDLEHEESKKAVFLDIINYRANATGYLKQSIVHCDDKLTERLMKLGADINGKFLGVTPLMDAVRLSNIFAVRHLIGNGVNVYKQDHEGNTALHMALKGFPLKGLETETMKKSFPDLYKKKVEIIKLLLRKDYAITENQKGETGWSIANKKKITEAMEIIKPKSPYFQGKFEDLYEIPHKPEYLEMNMVEEAKKFMQAADRIRACLEPF